MLKRIQIRGYKSVKMVDVALADLTVLFGPNAAGKSNFLDALLLSKFATSKTLKEAFDRPYRGKPLESFTFGEMGIKGLLDEEKLSLALEVDVRLSDAVVDAVNRQIREMRRSTVEEPESEVAPKPSQRCAKDSFVTGSRWKCCPNPGFCGYPMNTWRP